ncbi:MAG: TRAP transporter substrate-binding protein DctP [Deltaproteobacteria bacterium]|nr:TRAP transporter substrate-binding protein DctP [Deltaproteobacteria bacterium]
MTGHKRLMGVILTAVLVAAFTAPAAAEQKKIRWKFASLAPDGVGYARQIKKILFPVVEEVTEGNLELKVYWGGVMGDDEDYIKKMRIGQLDGAGFSGQGTTLACPEMAVVELPFLFKNYAEVDYIKSKMRDQFDKIIADNGYMALSWTDQDFDQLYSTKYPLNNLEAFKRARFLTWYGPLEEALFIALGASPIPVSVPEASASLRQGVVDAAIGPAIWVVGAQMYSTVKFVYPIKIRYSPAVILISLESWKELPKKYVDELFAMRPELEAKYCAEVRKDNKKCLEAIIRYGVREGKINSADLKEIKKRAKTIWYEKAGELYPKKTLDELISYLEEYRKANG